MLLRYGFGELGLHRIELSVTGYNLRAIATYRRAGFVEEGRRRSAIFRSGAWHDEVRMAILACEPTARVVAGLACRAGMFICHAVRYGDDHHQDQHGAA